MRLTPTPKLRLRPTPTLTLTLRQLPSDTKKTWMKLESLEVELGRKWN